MQAPALSLATCPQGAQAMHLCSLGTMIDRKISARRVQRRRTSGSAPPTPSGSSWCGRAWACPSSAGLPGPSQPFTPLLSLHTSGQLFPPFSFPLLLQIRKAQHMLLCVDQPDSLDHHKPLSLTMQCGRIQTPCSCIQLLSNLVNRGVLGMQVGFLCLFGCIQL